MTKIEILKTILDERGVIDQAAFTAAGYDPTMGQEEYDSVVAIIGRLNASLPKDQRLLRVGSGSLLDGVWPVYAPRQSS